MKIKVYTDIQQGRKLEILPIENADIYILKRVTMTQEEKDIIYKDACGRILYKPYAAYEFEGKLIQVQITGMEGDEPTSPFYGYSFDTWGHIPHDNVRLYLRPLSSMTDEEKSVILLCNAFIEPHSTEFKMDFYNQHYLDYRNLIEKGLAIKAPEGMYKIK